MIHRTQRGAAACLAAVFASALVGLSAFSTAKPAEAFPKFATKEKKPCGFCHVNPAGKGPRNVAGIWYDKHNFSFEGYTPEKAEELYGTPAATPTPEPTPTPTPKPTPKPAAKPTPKPKPPAKKVVKKTAKAPAKKQ
jgi:outer membrane biosynthesis protein TonB